MDKLELSAIDCCNFKQLPSYEILNTLLNQAITALENEKSSYRPVDCKGNPGSLLALNKEKPAIIVPDIHARPFFVKNILNFNIPAKFKAASKPIPVEKALQDGRAYVVCVGDAFHTEKTGPRWEKIQKEFNSGVVDGDAMVEEMTECLAAFTALLTLKVKYPEYFHFLKGNHENILNVSVNGDFAFCKYADEGSMVKRFISQYYGEDILYLISCYENLLPFAAYGKYYVVTHAEPAKVFTKKQLIDARKYPEVIYSLIWTRNDVVTDSTVVPIMKNLLDKEDVEKALHFGGHRPVIGNYALRQDGKYIQIHNPARQNICVVSSKRKFNPQKDIYEVKP